MKLYNTMTKKKEEFVPLEEGKVGMYVCGPTVYDYIHVGNARCFIVFDVLRRYLEHLGYKVTFVQNITDVDDKLINRAKREETTVSALAEKFTAEYLADTRDLGLKPATYSPKATEHIKEIIALIQALESKGLAYAVECGDVYFDTQAFPQYGKLSGQDMEELEAGARVEVGEIKRHPMDFALWKAMKPGEPAWDSPWGQGRPGWHIECSAMSMKYLGATLDIHAGGQDLIFPHHENEIAQSEGATGKPFVRYWLHNGYLNIENQKMSKSLGNFFTVKDILLKFDAEVLRLFLLSAHYRSPLNFSIDFMRQAETALQRLYTAKDNLLHLLGEESEGPVPESDELETQFIHEFKEAMDDDLNTADAIGSLFSLVKYYNTRYIQSGIVATKPEIRGAVKILQELSGVLGLLGKKTDDIPEEILVMADQRKRARDNRNWALSDKLRDGIKAKGYLVEDTKEGQKVKAL
jgi:cysteinyl-tRNA synthetase